MALSFDNQSNKQSYFNNNSGEDASISKAMRKAIIASAVVIISFCHQRRSIESCYKTLLVIDVT